MTEERKGFWKQEDRWGNRDYYLDGDPHPFRSVTTWTSKGEPKTGIDFIKRKKCAECAIDDYAKIIGPLVKAGAREQAIDYVMDAASREWQSSLDLGTTIHEVAEAMGNGWPLPDAVEMIAGPIIEQLDPEDPNEETPDAVRTRVRAEVEPRIEALRMFFDDWHCKLVWSEVTVFNRKYDYAGTFDGILEVEVDGRTFRILIDWKTTKAGKQGHGIYASTALQLAAYRHAEFAVDKSGARIPVPKVDAAYAVNILKGKYAVVPVNCTDDDKPERTCPSFRNFLYVQAVAKFVKDGANTLLGDPVAPPIRKVEVPA